MIYAGPCSEASEIIGYSCYGSPLTVDTCLPANVTQSGLPRIFILAGQHGDEGEAREAALEFLDRFRSAPSAVGIAVLADANPDGSAANTRRNGADLDLNRDHLLLSAPETRAIHSFVHRWKPDLIIDVHTYRPGRPELLERGLVFVQDVMVDITTNPAICAAGVSEKTQNELMDGVKRRVAEGGYRCDRYTLVRPSGMVRHSNFDVIDARNGLALRYGVPVVLLEGRRPAPGDPPGFSPARCALVRSLESVVEWAANHASRLAGQPCGIARSGLIPVRCRYAPGVTRQWEMLSATKGDIHKVEIPGDYLPCVETTHTIRLPRAYGVPVDSPILEVLRRHHFESRLATQFANAAVERHRLLSPLPKPHAEEHFPLPALRTVRATLDDGFVCFSTEQPGGYALALMLDPESQFSTHLLCLGPELKPGMLYPVARIL